MKKSMGMTGSVKPLLFFIVGVGLINGDWIRGVYSDSSYLECARYQVRVSYVMCKMGMYSKTGLEPCYLCPAGRFSLPGQKKCA